jgi:hypothetical protein
MRPADPSPDVHLIQHAQAFVDAWRRDHGRRPFHEAVVAEEHAGLGELLDSERRRVAFRTVANAIRVGSGHAETNPEPLLELVHQSMSGRSEPVVREIAAMVAADRRSHRLKRGT